MRIQHALTNYNRSVFKFYQHVENPNKKNEMKVYIWHKKEMT